MRARSNPFIADRINNIRYRLQDSSWEELMERLVRFDYRASIIGPEGSGKTTLLEQLRARLEQSEFTVRSLRADIGQRSVPTRSLHWLATGSDSRDIIMLDGADHLPGRSWRHFRRLSKSARGLIVTTHNREMLPCLVRCTTSPELLQEIVSDLTGFEGESLRQTAEVLFGKHRGNIREALREFYDIYARKE
jgi:predicted AAA+ superfamily ATPase